MDSTNTPPSSADIAHVTAHLGRRGKLIVVLQSSALLDVLSAFEGGGLVVKRLGLVVPQSSDQQVQQAVVVAQRAKPGGLIVHALWEEPSSVPP